MSWKTLLVWRTALIPFRVQVSRETLETSRINVVRPFKQNSCRTAVGQPRPSTRFDCNDAKGFRPRLHEARLDRLRRFLPWPTAWMAGTSPRLSGSCCAPIQLQLARVARLGGIVVAQARDVFSVHQIGAHESSEFEEAV